MAGRRARAVGDVPEVSTGDTIQEAWGDQVAQAINGHAHSGAAGMAGEDAVSHPTLVNVGPDDHHARLHAADHAPGGADPIPGAPSPKAPKIEVFTADGAFVKDPDAVGVIVEVVGGGGGGGGTMATGSGERSTAGGGGGGGYARKAFAASGLAASEPIAIGAGGTAGPVGDNDGGAGGTTSFGAGATLVHGTGGLGGAGSGTSGSGLQSLGGEGGDGVNGDLNISGDKGGIGAQGYNAVLSNIGYGGGSQLGPSVYGGANAAGVAGAAHGGGGSGAQNNPSLAGKAGGAGAKGVVVVTTYY